MEETITTLENTSMSKESKLSLLLDLLILESQNNQHLRDIAYEYGLIPMADAYNKSTNNLKAIKCAIMNLN